MIKITFPKRDKNIEKWEEKLTELVVGFQLEKEKDASEITLKDGDTHLEGAIAIQQFIDDLEKEVNDWRTPRCGV